MNNIAEGFDRKGDKESIRYLSMSKGSCAEVRSMLYMAQDYSYIKSGDVIELHELALRINKILAGFIRTLRHRESPSQTT